ncbi:MAG: ABC-F family ATP-binding cassette domain-containing protein [Proteobacteria bacterium]|nr:ABC-F family ATP-binding cassette domain-containing protein [Pseudomonadota bacterium]
MSYLISYQSLEKSYQDLPLFTNLTLGFSEGEKVGLIGANGSGKSTLLKIFAGEVEPDKGVRSMKKHTRVVYLPQIDKFDDENSVEDALFSAMSDMVLEEHQKYTAVQKTIGLGEFTNPDQKTNSLSGGWRKRLAICCSLIRQPDILFLDEPTNHLDIEGILWLETILKNASFSFVLVSHDRYFLENITNKIVELGRLYPEGCLKVNGNYSEFVRKRSEFLKTQKDKESALANVVRQERNWLAHGPKARTTKAKFRIEKAAMLGEELKDIHHRNQQNKTVEFNFDSTNRKTKNLLVATNIGISMGGASLFKNLSFKLKPGTRIGLLGRNGSGKSTLIRILAQSIKPDEGAIETADTLRMVTFDQNRQKLDQEAKLRTALSPAGDAVVYRDRSVHVVTWAKRFLFSPDQLDLPVGRLSGGEQARILIAHLMRQPADILLLDEPTNDLDIPSIEVLEESLSEFPGAVVIVSHDRFFLDRLTDMIIGFDGKGNAGIFADYFQWLEACGTRKPEKKEAKPQPAKKAPTSAEKKFSFKHQYELDRIEETILKAEENVSLLEEDVQNPSIINDPVRMKLCCEKLKDAQEKVEHLYARWQELESYKNP